MNIFFAWLLVPLYLHDVASSRDPSKFKGLNKTWKVEVEVEAIKPGKLKVDE